MEEEKFYLEAERPFILLKNGEEAKKKISKNHFFSFFKKKKKAETRKEILNDYLLKISHQRKVQN